MGGGSPPGPGLPGGGGACPGAGLPGTEGAGRPWIDIAVQVRIHLESSLDIIAPDDT